MLIKSDFVLKQNHAREVINKDNFHANVYKIGTDTEKVFFYKIRKNTRKTLIATEHLQNFKTPRHAMY